MRAGVAAAAPDPPDPGKTTAGTSVSNGTEYRYLLHTPTSYRPGRAAPLLVMVHGCQTTAEQEMKATASTRSPSGRASSSSTPTSTQLGRAQPGPANQCWKFPYPPAW